MYHNTRVFVRIRSSLGRDGVHLFGHVLSYVNVAILKNNNSVSEYEVHGTIDVAVAVELALGVNIESVLVAFEAASIED